MPLQSFASTAQMSSRTKGAITLSSHPFLDDELAAASRAIRDACGWHVAKVETLHYRRVFGRSREYVLLPAMQIQAVTAATIDGVVWDADQLASVEFDPETGMTNLYGRTVDVTYTAGFETVPESLVTLTLQIAARALGSPLGAVREQTLVSNVQWSSTAPGVAGGSVILPHELVTLAPYVLGRVA